jgi:hypothetical protein
MTTAPDTRSSQSGGAAKPRDSRKKVGLDWGSAEIEQRPLPPLILLGDRALGQSFDSKRLPARWQDGAEILVAGGLIDFS